MKEQESILNDQTGNNFQDVTEELIKIEQVEGTPFQTVTFKDRGTFVALGQGRITETFPTREEAISEINVNNWYFILSVIYAMIKEMPLIEKEVNKE